ncbi:MAG: hypothetical protein DDT35_01502 [Firmicutes bacterium]|nr:hypothetical protein [Bacillota bacterium]
MRHSDLCPRITNYDITDYTNGAPSIPRYWTSIYSRHYLAATYAIKNYCTVPAYGNHNHACAGGGYDYISVPRPGQTQVNDLRAVLVVDLVQGSTVNLCDHVQ